MKEIVPAILEKDFTAVREKLLQINGLVNWAQIDVVDGRFAPGETWNTPEDLLSFGALRLRLEVHLMVVDPAGEVVRWLSAAERFIVHCESEASSLGLALDLITASGREAALALLAPTPLETVERFLKQIGLVQLMGISKVGLQGQPSEPALNTAERIKDLRARYSGIKISVDGGVSLATAPRFLEAGADQLVVGSAVWRSSDPLQTLRELKGLAADL